MCDPGIISEDIIVIKVAILILRAAVDLLIKYRSVLLTNLLPIINSYQSFVLIVINYH